MKIQITTSIGGQSEIMDFNDLKPKDLKVLLSYFKELTISVIPSNKPAKPIKATKA